MTAELPPYLSARADSGEYFIQMSCRNDPDWRRDVTGMIRNPRGFGVDPSPLLEGLSVERLQESVAPVARRGAEDLLKLIVAGSLFDGVKAESIASDHGLTRSVHEALDLFGPEAEYFTNHGHAEDGDDAQFLVSGFHYNSMAVTLYDICLIAVASDRILVAWRFEDA
ncbi:hypothetical protein ABZ734_14570 [Streptomyces sp. NPDC006660]|uniref:hypothetical protein n=1 Tax=unclassified Streptomyces TaxID=2593676 RepID=UPI0033C2FEB0